MEENESEKRHSSGIQIGNSNLCLWQYLSGTFYGGRYACGNLFGMSSVFYRKTEISGLRRKSREIPEKIRRPTLAGIIKIGNGMSLGRKGIPFFCIQN